MSQQRSRDELAERVAELEDIKRKQQSLDARMDALTTQIDELKDLLIGDEREFTQDEVVAARNFFDRMQDTEAELEALSRQTRAAVATADARSDGGNPTKKELVVQRARNRLVTNAAVRAAPKQRVKLAAIQDGIDRADVAYQTVKDAATELQTRWDAITRMKDESGDWALVLDEEHLSKELVYAVEHDLGRDDLTKRLISENGQEGGKR